MVSTLEQMQVPNRTGPGVRRSKRPLLASRTRCNVLWKPPKFGNKVKIGIKVQFSPFGYPLVVYIDSVLSISLSGRGISFREELRDPVTTGSL